MQGLNTTPVHGHAALFGVYGMLGIGLMLFSLRVIAPAAAWKENLLSVGFWGPNIGLFAMVVGSLLPVGLMQTWAAPWSMATGMRAAPSSSRPEPSSSFDGFA
jgi:nitric oxide reductase subunit B